MRKNEVIGFVNSQSSLTEVLPENATATRIIPRIVINSFSRNQLDIVQNLMASRVERKWLYAAETAWAAGSGIELGFYYLKSKNDREAEGAVLTFEKIGFLLGGIESLAIALNSKMKLAGCKKSLSTCRNDQ